MVDSGKKLHRTMSLAEVLKGASSANLRKTEIVRSPGGTPIDTPNRPKPATSQNSQDFIAMALKKKFGSMSRLETPDTVHKRKIDGDSGWDDDTPPASPIKAETPTPVFKSKYTPVFMNDENTPPVVSILKLFRGARKSRKSTRFFIFDA